MRKLRQQTMLYDARVRMVLSDTLNPEIHVGDCGKVVDTDDERYVAIKIDGWATPYCPWNVVVVLSVFKRHWEILP